MIGKKLSPILVELENALWEHDVKLGVKPEFTDDGLRAAMKIFMSVIMDKMYTLQSHEKIELEDRIKMATKLGDEVRALVKVYTNIDTHDLYK